MTPGSVLLSTVVGVTLATGGFAIGLGATGIAEGSTSFWYLSRASGFVAYLLLWGSVMWGLLLSTGTGRRWMRPPHLLDAHQFLSTAAVGFASFHGLVLMGDRYVSFPLRAIVVPFTAATNRCWLRFGQLAFWLSVLLIGSFHLRRHLGGQAWRRLHYASFVAFCLACSPRAGTGQRERDPVGQPPVPGNDSPRDLPLPYRVLSTPRLHGLLIESRHAPSGLAFSASAFVKGTVRSGSYTGLRC